MLRPVGGGLVAPGQALLPTAVVQEGQSADAELRSIMTGHERCPSMKLGHVNIRTTQRNETQYR